MPIVIPFLKSPCSLVLMAPSYMPKNEWIINTSHHKQARKNFSASTPIVFQLQQKVSLGGFIGGHTVDPMEQAQEHGKFGKNVIQKSYLLLVCDGLY